VPKEYNPFLGYLDTHPGADAAALKQLFRVLAKRTHPDLGTENEAAFVALQNAYNEAIAILMAHEEGDRQDTRGAAGARDRDAHGSSDVEGVWFPSTPRERVLHFLYRYKAHLPSVALESSKVPPACRRAFANACDAAAHYTEEARYALTLFDEQFHGNRATLLRYPEVGTKYRPFMQGLGSFFDYFVIPNAFNRRVADSYLNEIKPVTDFDPGAPPEVRSNRSAAARSALYRMRVWLEHELASGPCRVL
jgi:hypothetical protein